MPANAFFCSILMVDAMVCLCGSPVGRAGRPATITILTKYILAPAHLEIFPHHTSLDITIDNRKWQSSTRLIRYVRRREGRAVEATCASLIVGSNSLCDQRLSPSSLSSLSLSFTSLTIRHSIHSTRRRTRSRMACFWATRDPWPRRPSR
jgi:hypothetical protein